MLKVPFIVLKNLPPGIKVQIIVLPVWYNKSMESKTGHRKAVSTMTQQFRYVGGHIEVFAENGEFLFSADTMQEHGRSRPRNAYTRNVRMYTMPK